MWMVTGDKRETALNVAATVGLISEGARICDVACIEDAASLPDLAPLRSCEGHADAAVLDAAGTDPTGGALWLVDGSGSDRQEIIAAPAMEASRAGQVRVSKRLKHGLEG